MASKVFQPEESEDAAEDRHAAQNYGECFRMITEAIWEKRRHDIEGDIEEMHQPGPRSQRKHDRQTQFGINAEERQERKKEMPENNQQSILVPRPLFALHIPSGFLRHVGVPDDEVLRK